MIERAGFGQVERKLFAPGLGPIVYWRKNLGNFVKSGLHHIALNVTNLKIAVDFI